MRTWQAHSALLAACGLRLLKACVGHPSVGGSRPKRCEQKTSDGLLFDWDRNRQAGHLLLGEVPDGNRAPGEAPSTRPACGEAPTRQEADGALPCPGEVPSGVQLAATLSRCCSCTACSRTSTAHVIRGPTSTWDCCSWRHLR
jgi:hypothetical protein